MLLDLRLCSDVVSTSVSHPRNFEEFIYFLTADHSEVYQHTEGFTHDEACPCFQDNSGNINASELRNVLRALGYQPMRVVIQEVLQEVDFESDAELDFEAERYCMTCEFFHFMLVFKQRDGFSQQESLLELTVESIRYVGKVGLGAFRLNDKQLGWKGAGADGANQHQWEGKDLQSAEWHSSCGGGHGLLKLRFKAKTGPQAVRFADFEVGHLPKIKEHLSSAFKVKLLEFHPTVKGWSWGDMELQEDSLRISSGDRVFMEVDTGKVSQVTSKDNELNLILQDAEKDGEILQGIRFFVPGGEGSEMSAEAWRDELNMKTTKADSAAVMLGQFSDISFVAPRGKHDLQVFPDLLQIRGKTATYLVKWSSIKKLLQVDMPDKKHKMLVVGVNPPIRNGNVQHEMIGMKMEIRGICDTSVSIPKEAWETAKGNGLEKSLPSELEQDEVPTFEAVACILKEMSGQNPLKPTSRFQVPDGTSSVPCSLITDTGHLFLFQKQLLFVPKPIFWRPFSRLESVEFKDSLMRKNTFELVLTFAGERAVEFKQVPKEHQAAVFNFFEQSEDLKQKIQDPDQVRKRLEASKGTRGRSPSPIRRMVDDPMYQEEDDDDFSDAATDDSDVAPQPKKKKLRSRK
eukprot:Skav210871  [mRNA]  locus=scaffold7397:14746:20683:+ [translate_table: standard]